MLDRASGGDLQVNRDEVREVAADQVAIDRPIADIARASPHRLAPFAIARVS